MFTSGLLFEIITRQHFLILGVYDMATTPLNKLKQSGEYYFKLKEDSNAVYIINHYNRCDKTYTVSNCENMNERFIKANKPVFIGFTY
jgi:hypothetical protein|tara:strand:+ start:246 stop:509 length:264 start_codon:yes stop_codon:yes gene_type:complete